MLCRIDWILHILICNRGRQSRYLSFQFHVRSTFMSVSFKRNLVRTDWIKFLYLITHSPNLMYDFNQVSTSGSMSGVSSILVSKIYEQSRNCEQSTNLKCSLIATTHVLTYCTMQREKNIVQISITLALLFQLLTLQYDTEIPLQVWNFVSIRIIGNT